MNILSLNILKTSHKIMEKTNLVRLLKCLSKHELREFGKFVRSPYHNNRKDVIRLYDIIRTGSPDFSDNIISKEMVFEKLYPGKKYDAEHIIRLSSFLFKLGREFLTISNFKQDKFYNEFFLLDSLNNHNNTDKLFEKEYRYALNMLNSQKLNEEFFYRKWSYEMQKIDFSLKRNMQEEICGNVLNAAEYQIYFFIVMLNHHYSDMTANKSTFNYDFNDSAAVHFINNFNFSEFFKNLKKGPGINEDYYNYLAYHCNNLMTKIYPENDNYYTNLKEYAFKNIEKLSDIELAGRYISLFLYVDSKIHRGNLSYLPECFNLLKDGLEKKLSPGFLNEDSINLYFFRNYVIYGIANKEYDEVEKFISQYGSKIKEDTRHDMVCISNAWLQFERKKFDLALEYLSTVSYTFPKFKLDVKNTCIKIYYETNKYEAFFSLIDTYKHYLKNDRIITDINRERITNFLNYAGRLVKMKTSGLLDGLNTLKNEITENMKLPLLHKPWLLEKADELDANE
jgi:hypothetical protein